MNFWLILMVSLLASGLAVAGLLVWIGANAMIHGRGMAREAAVTIASLRRALRSIYNDTLRESLPADFLALLGKLTRQAPKT